MKVQRWHPRRAAIAKALEKAMPLPEANGEARAEAELLDKLDKRK